MRLKHEIPESSNWTKVQNLLRKIYEEKILDWYKKYEK